MAHSFTHSQNPNAGSEVLGMATRRRRRIHAGSNPSHIGVIDASTNGYVEALSASMSGLLHRQLNERADRFVRPVGWFALVCQPGWETRLPSEAIEPAGPYLTKT